MGLSVFYCNNWFRLKRIAIGPMNEQAARAKHLAGKSYVALIGSDSQPSCFVEMLIDKKMVGVGFLDDKGREYLTYQFKYIDAEKLFLTMATHREYYGDEDKVVSGTSYIFKENGELIIRREGFNPHNLEKSKSTFDPVGNYENAPEFGKYSGVVKLNR
ncbi:lytic transglycosylase [Pseudomonas sp. FP597]|uniref:lytic transglycosylase n=1 Tax=Pseudomonas sp. FP597 TaxID=2954096 RepID=UPI0027363EC3|nr:lytic transglycosylase [Pseudomonas sp. FP597]WLI06914.1 lytic transglycosylase [Pseudomonas sp. FP597]